jgi:hypothetical protein
MPPHINIEDAFREMKLCSAEGIDHQPLLVGSDDLLGRVFVIEDALVDIDDAVQERDLEVQSRLRDHAERLAQAHHQRLVGLIDRKQGAVGNDQRHEHESSKDTAGDIEPHRLPPVCGVWAGFGGAAGLGFCGRVNSVSGR